MTAPAPLGTGAQPDPQKPAEPDAPAELQEHAQLQEHAEFQEPADEEIAEPGKRLAPLAVIAMIVVVLGIAAGLVAFLTHGFHSRTRLVYQVPAVFKLRPGDCFNSGTNDISITPRACSSPHDAEVFATFHATGTSWPGDAALQERAASGCATRVAGYMNPVLATSALAQEYVYPNSVAWKAGIRTIVCDVRSLSGPITGSVRKSSLHGGADPAVDGDDGAGDIGARS